MNEGEVGRAYNLLKQHRGPFRIYLNPMRSDGVFVGEDAPVEPYAAVRGLGGPLFPAVPQRVYVLPYQVSREVAEELLRRLAGDGQGDGRVAAEGRPE